MSTLIIAVVQVAKAGDYLKRLANLLSTRFSLKESLGETRISIGTEDEPSIFKAKDKEEAISKLDASFQMNQNFGCYLTDAETREEISLFAEGNELVMHLSVNTQLLAKNYKKIFKDVVMGLGYKVENIKVTIE